MKFVPLAEQFRKRSQGVGVLHYVGDDDDYRCAWFNASSIVHGDEETMFDVGARAVREVWIPDFLKRVAETRKEPGEPQHAGYEVYWEGELIYQEDVPDYEPVPLPEEK